jgi:acetyl-CoA carboxylase biotin carboxyl carrier protein
MIPELEQLAALLESHQLTRLEYERDNMRVVMERTPVSAGANGVLSSLHPLSCPASQDTLAAAVFTGAPDVSAGALSRDNTAASGVSAVASTGAAQARQDQNTQDQDASSEAHAVTITAPLVGIAYRTPSPQAAPFVECGQQVTKGDVLCLIEAMKLFNEITAPFTGVVSAILFEDGTLAEYGAPLITITPITPITD